MRSWIILVFALTIFGGAFLSPVAAEVGEKSGVNAHSFKMRSLSGKETDLGQYQGKLVLAVNVASQCGYTPQYAGLQALHEKYRDRGLVVAGFPCNQFGKQEPGTSKEIAAFCESRYHVTFDMFEKVEVNGEGACELYQFLTAQEASPAGKGKVKWNFEKFLIGQDGQVVARFGSSTNPDDESLIQEIEKRLSDQ